MTLCRWDLRGGRRVGGAVLLGFVGRVSRGWRCAFVMCAQDVVWVALVHWDWWVACRVSSAMPLGLVGSMSCR